MYCPADRKKFKIHLNRLMNVKQNWAYSSFRRNPIQKVLRTKGSRCKLYNQILAECYNRTTGSVLNSDTSNFWRETRFKLLPLSAFKQNTTREFSALLKVTNLRFQLNV